MSLKLLAIRRSVGTVFAVIAVLLTMGVSGIAAQDVTVDCTAFASIEEANEYYAANPDAQAAIDDDNDGQACEVYFGLETREGETNGAPPAAPDDPLDQPAQTGGDDLDCEDFTTQEEAQAVLDADPADPNNLDPNGDGVACALLPSAAGAATQDTGEDPAVSEQQADGGNPDREERRRNRDRQDDAATEVVCADFATIEDAQAAYDADPEGLASLDDNGDGIVCEELPSADAEPAADDQNQDRQNRRDRQRDAEPTPEPVTTVDQPTPVAIQDIDCADFATQEEAQAQYNLDPSDPFNLDPNGDGFACSSLPSANPTVIQVPRTGSGPGTSHLLAVLVVAAIAAAAAGAALNGAYGAARKQGD